MSDGGIDRFPVNQLPDRYQLARSALYTRLDALSIKTEKVGNKAYVNREQLELLDDLHEFIQRGGNTAEFLDMRGIQSGRSETPEMSSGLSTVPTDIVKLVSIIASEIVSKIQPTAPQPDRFAYYETLERAVQNGWLLRTSEIAYLLDISPGEMQNYGDRFSEAGFTFTKAGFRAPGEIAWRVTKSL